MKSSTSVYGEAFFNSLLGAPAARFVQQHRSELYPTTPMLLAAVELRRVEQSLLSEQDAVAAERADYEALFGNILRLLPETKFIAIIVGNSPNERFWTAEHRRIWVRSWRIRLN